LVHILTPPFLFLFLLFFPLKAEAEEETGSLYVYFREEKVGYEEFSWKTEEFGYSLQVRGMMDKPIPLETKNLFIRLDRNFIPEYYSFLGAINGVPQYIECLIAEGEVQTVMRVAGHEERSSLKIRRDAFLLPNAIFSPYLIVSKKYGCSLENPIELSAYIVPQLEVPFQLELKEGAICTLVLKISSMTIELETDEKGSLRGLVIPSQNLKISSKRIL